MSASSPLSLFGDVSPVAPDGCNTGAAPMAEGDRGLCGGAVARREIPNEFEAVFEHAPIPMLLVDSAAVLQRVNHAAMALGQGETMVKKRGGEALHCVHHYSAPQGCGTGHACGTCTIRRTITHTARTGESSTQVEAAMTLLVGKNPVHRELLLTTTPLPAGGERMVLACLEDVTERNVAMRRLSHQSFHDVLTGLPNRALLQERLQQAIHRHQKSAGNPYAVLFLDFDRFKNVNDSLGHDAGDRLLREIARRLTEALGCIDAAHQPAEGVTVSRFGGDEFVVLLESPRAPEFAAVIADRLLDVLAAPYQFGGQEIVSTASIGIVTSECGHSRAENVLRDADTAMYEAKAAGKARAVVVDATMRARTRRRLMLESGMRKGMERGEFQLHYQPIVSLETRRVHGFEALARWQHAEQGMISPSEFIPIFEETGMILALGEWVFSEACRQLGQWWKTYGREAAPSMSVNLSRRQLTMPGLARRFREMAQECGVDPGAIHLELTENAIMADAGLAATMLREIKAAGFKVDMDDFGTGYSSLASLHQFPMDVLKLDQSFVANLDRGRDFAALVNAITTLAENLGIQVVVEGVETAEQVATLQSLDCRLAQGFFFARPMCAAKAGEYLAGNR